MSTPQTAKQEPLERQLEQLERLVRFGGELAAALRTEFAYYWLHPDRQAQVPESADLVKKVDGLRGMASAYLRHLERARNSPPVQALALAKQIDRRALFEATQGLDVAARGLREVGKQRGWGSHGADRAAPIAASLRRMAAPAAPVPAAAPKTVSDRLKGWLAAMDAPKEAAEPPPPPPPSIGARRIAAYETSLALVVSLKDELRLPLATLHTALNQAESASQLPEGIVRDLIGELKAQPALKRAIEICLTQYKQVVDALPAYQAALAKAKGLPADQVGQTLQGHDLAKLKGVMLPLANLHVTFRAYPVARTLFPAPDVVQLRGDVPPVERSARVPAEPAPTPKPELPKAPPRPAPEKPKLDWRVAGEELSKKRLTLLTRFMANPNDRSVFKDNASVLSLVSDELGYQQEREMDRRMQLRLLLTGAPGADAAERRSALEKELGETRTLLSQLDTLKKFVAGLGQ